MRRKSFPLLCIFAFGYLAFGLVAIDEGLSLNVEQKRSIIFHVPATRELLLGCIFLSLLSFAVFGVRLVRYLKYGGR